MHYLSSVYLISQPLYVSGMFIVHRQEVFTVYCVYCSWYVLYVYVDWLLAGSGWNFSMVFISKNIYSGCVSVALGIRHAMRMRRIVICGLYVSTIFSYIIS
jgi:hypothetical protein